MQIAIILAIIIGVHRVIILSIQSGARAVRLSFSACPKLAVKVAARDSY